MSLDLVMRLIGMVVLGVVGWQIGSNLAGDVISDATVLSGVVLLSVAGAALGLLVTPYVTTRPLAWVRRRVGHVPANLLVTGTIGLLLGLLLAYLVTPPLSRLPGIFGQILPFLAAILFGYAGVQAAVLRERELLTLFQTRFGRRGTIGAKRYILLDTSVIIDGRIADIAQTGFIDATLLVPTFILSELQHIAGSREVLRRNRGKRGLEILNQLQKNSFTPLEISEMDVPEVPEADAKLVALARDLGARVLTTDYGLNKVAELQGVRVLNINELANAVKTMMLPGERLEIELIQSGREAGQGVGYLEDGTMVVVEQGQGAIGQKIPVEVTRILQTVAGRMIFAQRIKTES